MIGLMTLVEREIVRFYRQRSRVIGALLTPLLFWLMIGGGSGRSVQMGGAGTTPGSVPHEMNCRAHLFPGILVRCALLLWISVAVMHIFLDCCASVGRHSASEIICCLRQ